MRALLAEDDPLLSAALKRSLEQAGYAVDAFADGVQAELAGELTDYDVVILDLGLPRRPGTEVLRHWRAARRAMPVIVLTARDTWQEKVEVLNSGADDYVCKPFHTQELLARIATVLKRARAVAVPGPLKRGPLTLDEATRTARRDDGSRIDLSAVEFRLLRCFMLHAGHVLSQAQLTEHLYDHAGGPESNAIEVHVNHLRRKIGRDWIRTRRGQGYVFADPEAP